MIWLSGKLFLQLFTLLIKFPLIWINWIRACISGAYFVVLINGQASTWFTSSRGLRQGDPISPYFFPLLSQNLSALLNHVLYHNSISGFNHRLCRNFNHMMFADDLIVVTRASLSVAEDCRLCLSIYKDLMWQTPNVSKSTIHFPSWTNKKVCRAIVAILHMKLGSFPFKNLGFLIGPMRISNYCFQLLIDRAQDCVKAWNHNPISLPTVLC